MHADAIGQPLVIIDRVVDLGVDMAAWQELERQGQGGSRLT